ncbi:MAG: DUF2853 family protein [Robiginitomaculum sp.]|nr:DUF2853 family protein [Robiginitomaculum sp.]
MSNILSYVFCFGWLPWLIAGLLGLLLGWFFWGRKKSAGDLTIEGEGQLRSESDALRARVNELEGESGDLKGKLAAAVAGATAAGAATVAATAVATSGGDDDETYALEWRNRYLAARVKYLEGRISDTPKAKKKAAPKKRVAKKAVKKVAPKKSVPKKQAAKKVVKKKVVKKAAPKKAAKPRILYDKPTDGKPDDLKLISGVGPKLEKMLNKTGVYYFPQIANWKKSDVKMVNDKLGAFPGRIERDEWVRQAKGLAKGGSAGKVSKAKPAKKVAAKKAPAKKAVKAASPNAKYLADVRKFDPKASSAVIDNIVKYCGIALRSRDGSLVACSQEHELDTIAKGFATKKLGMTKGQMDAVKATCEEMKGTRFKNRVTFYYLMAKKARKMKVFR